MSQRLAPQRIASGYQHKLRLNRSCPLVIRYHIEYTSGSPLQVSRNKCLLRFFPVLSPQPYGSELGIVGERLILVVSCMSCTPWCTIFKLYTVPPNCD